MAAQKDAKKSGEGDRYDAKISVLSTISTFEAPLMMIGSYLYLFEDPTPLNWTMC